MKEKLLRQDAVAAQIAFEMTNISEALFPNVQADQLLRQLLALQQFWMNAHDQGFLVVAAVEDADAPALWKVTLITPEEIMIKILRSWA